MPTRFLFIALVALLTTSCGGGDKHLPSSNPPEYDPKKTYTTPATPPSVPAASVAKPAESAPPPIQLPPLEPGPNEKGEWKKVPVKPEALQLFKGRKSPCETLSNIVQGLGSAQLFAGKEGQSLKQSLGPQAESVARSLDQQLFDNFKAQLGPNVADCPSPVPARQNSGLEQLFSPARVVRTNGLSNGSFQLAQALAVPATRSESRQEAPPGWVGWKTMARSIWPETAGNRRSMVTILGGKVLKCPTPDGVVPGDFEFAVVLDQTIVESGVTRMVHIGLRASATLKGQLGDDAKVQYVEGDISTVAERNATDVPTSLRRQRSQFRFVPNRDELWPGFPTNIAVSATGWDIEGATPQENSFVSDAVAAVMLWGGQNYLDAEREWNKPNTCVEITFTPATKTKKFVPSESTPVKTELRTKKEQALVPAKFKEAQERPREGNGRVSPREKESQPNTPATFTYQAPPTRVRHSGFWVTAVSRAGVAEAKDGEWELAEGSYVLEFRSMIVSSDPDGDPGQSQAFAVIPLVASGEVSPSGDTKYIGQGMITYQTSPLPNWEPCTALVRGQGTIPMRVFQAFIRVDPPQSGANASQGGSAKIELLYGIVGGSQETTTGGPAYINYQCVPNKPKSYSFWSSHYISGREEMSGDPMQMFRVKDWTYVGQNGVVATKALRSTCGGICDQEVATFTLKEGDGSGASQPR